MTRLAALAMALTLLAAGCGGGGGENASSRQPRRLTDLRQIDQLRSLFNTRSGEPRLVLLVSPT